MTILPNFYNTFVDVLEFHDVTIEVIISLATVQFNFDIVSYTIIYTIINVIVYFIHYRVHVL